MREIILGASEHDFRVARDFDLARLPAAIHDREAAHLDVVLRRDADLKLRFEIVVPGENVAFSRSKETS
jgi:hypothetical protein